MFQKWLHRLNERIERSGPMYFSFGLFGSINYPLSYFMWHDLIKIYNPLLFRIIAFALCFPLMFYKRWPDSLKKYLPLYWCLVILYCIPFFETYIWLMEESTTWKVNLTLALFLFVMLVDWLLFIVLLIVGVTGALALYYFTAQSIHFIDKEMLSLLCYMYIVTIFISAVFTRNREKMAYEKLQSIRKVALNIAHELRTPLAAINLGVDGIRDYLKLPQTSNVIPKQPDNMNKVINYIETEIALAHNTINMLLANVSRNKHQVHQAAETSIRDCVNKALGRYPFSVGIAEKIEWDDSKDFIVRGVELQIIHVLFNLIKNSLYFINKAGKGNITIWLENHSKYNCLYFMDTGTGMSKKTLKHIFNQYYTKTEHGYGIGLSFCRSIMSKCGGSISCDSVLGKYTQFILKFPKIAKDSHCYES